MEMFPRSESLQSARANVTGAKSISREAGLCGDYPKPVAELSNTTPLLSSTSSFHHLVKRMENVHCSNRVHSAGVHDETNSVCVASTKSPALMFDIQCTWRCALAQRAFSWRVLMC